MVFKITSDIGLKMAFAGREIPRAMIKIQKKLKPQRDFSEKSNHYIECVKSARGAHFGRLAKTGPEGTGSYANSGQKSAAQIYAAVGSLKKNRQRRMLTNIGLTIECPSQAGKLVRGIGRRELGLSRNSAAKTLAACTQMRIRQRRNWQPARRCEFGSAQQLVQVRGLTWHDLKLGRRTVQGM
jgi:hypothetical protein